VARIPVIGWALAAFIDRRWPGARSSGVARTRFIDAALGKALEDGFRQVVLLGAGFDSRAYRLPAAARARILEVDHPNTSRRKRRHVAKRLGTLPSHVSFVEIDFNRQSLAEVLHAQHLDVSRPIYFVWEGVTQYLTADAVDATLRCVASAAPGSRILFTYVHRGAIGPHPTFAGMATLKQTLANAAEPWTFGFDPSDLPGQLATRGLRLMVDLGAKEYRGLCEDARMRQAKGYEFYRIAVAEVPLTDRDG
jgi:methyltransferase (TIGR00027 family)